MYDGVDRACPCKTELDVSLCFAALLRWALSWWRSGRLALAVAPTSKNDETVAIVVSVLYRSCAIPVAWRIRRANQRGSWMEPIVELLRELAPAAPREMTVVVLCDRGLASPKLWKQIRAQSLPPATTGGLAPLHEVSEKRHLLRRGWPEAASPRLRSPSRHRLDWQWYVEQEEPWIILTDLPPEEVGVSWYALRFWIELGFKALKSLGWQWHKTRRTDPGTYLPPLAGAVGGDVAGPGLWRPSGRRL